MGFEKFPPDTPSSLEPKFPSVLSMNKVIAKGFVEDYTNFANSNVMEIIPKINEYMKKNTTKSPSDPIQKMKSQEISQLQISILKDFNIHLNTMVQHCKMQEWKGKSAELLKKVEKTTTKIQKITNEKIKEEEKKPTKTLVEYNNQLQNYGAELKANSKYAERQVKAFCSIVKTGWRILDLTVFNVFRAGRWFLKNLWNTGLFIGRWSPFWMIPFHSLFCAVTLSYYVLSYIPFALDLVDEIFHLITHLLDWCSVLGYDIGFNLPKNIRRQVTKNKYNLVAEILDKLFRRLFAILPWQFEWLYDRKDKIVEVVQAGYETAKETWQQAQQVASAVNAVFNPFSAGQSILERMNQSWNKEIKTEKTEVLEEKAVTITQNVSGGIFDYFIKGGKAPPILIEEIQNLNILKPLEGNLSMEKLLKMNKLAEDRGLWTNVFLPLDENGNITKFVDLKKDGRKYLANYLNRKFAFESKILELSPGTEDVVFIVSKRAKKNMDFMKRLEYGGETEGLKIRYLTKEEVDNVPKPPKPKSYYETFSNLVFGQKEDIEDKEDIEEEDIAGVEMGDMEVDVEGKEIRKKIRKGVKETCRVVGNLVDGNQVCTDEFGGVTRTIGKGVKKVCKVLNANYWDENAQFVCGFENVEEQEPSAVAKAARKIYKSIFY
jgi:hypothetical protein